MSKISVSVRSQCSL